MNPKLVIAALAFAAAFPALAGTIVTTAATPHLSRIARADNVATHGTMAGTGESAIASDPVRQKNTPTAKGGLLNTDASPRQARAAARDTNRKISRSEITPRKSPE